LFITDLAKNVGEEEEEEEEEGEENHNILRVGWEIHRMWGMV